jgi:tRNA-2-methylthio-N6-dimethylallyladenosine synthase
MAQHVGNTVEVLVEGNSRTNEQRRFGRTPHNRVVNFDGDAPIGAIVEVKVSASTQSSLTGALHRVVSLPAVTIPEVAPQPESCVVA